MTRIRVGWMIIVLMITGCSDKDSLPAGVLSKEDMQNVLWDMIQADQYSAAYLAKDSAHINIRLESMRLYDQVFQLHHISREEFNKSYKYYLAHPELTQTLLDSMQAMGNRLRAENYNRSTARPVSTPPVTTVPAPRPPNPAPRPRDHVAKPLTPVQKADSLRRRKLVVQ